ncbi:MAG: PAS domain S-box protein [Vulcanimicrobiota bacterium]
MSNNTDKLNIIHVDDEVSFLDLFAAMFSRWFNIVSVENPEEALKEIRNEDIDAVITDYDMPEVNGLELLKNIKKFQSDLPVILYTGQGNEEVARKAFLLGADDYFSKNISGLAYRERLVNSIKRSVEKRKSDRARIESEKKYKTYIENAPEAIFILDEKLNIIEVNEAGINKLKYSRVDLSQMNFTELIDKKFVATLDDVQREILTEKKPANVLPLVSRHNEVINFSISSSMVSDEELLIIARDITQIIEAEQVLQKSKEVLQSIFKGVPACIGIVRNRVFQEVNDYMLDLIGYEREELIGKSARMLYPTEEDFEYVGEEKYRQIDKTGAGTVETRWLTKKGEILNVLLTSRILSTEKDPPEVIFIASNITKQRNNTH